MIRPFIILFFITISSLGQTITLNEKKAFPDAWGFGSYTTGGDGGAIVEVTNLNDSGAGSLRAALTLSGPRIVIFRVGGTINLETSIRVQSGNLTIAGETAPGDGILIRGNLIQVEKSNVIIRNIRFRLGTPTSGTSVDAFSITAWAGSTVEDVIVDHCSFSWAQDENFNIRANDRETAIVRNITVQNCLMSEVGKNMLLYLNVQNVSVYQNMLALAFERNIRANYGYPDVLRFEMINNLVYGWQNAATNPSNGLKYTVKNNKYKLSTQQGTDSNRIVGASAADAGVPDSWTYAYIDGNIIPSGYQLYADRVAPYLKSSPYLMSNITPVPASEIEGKILSHVGASISNRDAVDARIINNYNASTGVVAYSGTYPTIADGTPYPDSNNDGIDDTWATTHGISSATQIKSTYVIDSKNIINDAGYNAREIFFADLAGDFDRLPLDAPVGVPVITLNGSNPTTLQVGQPYNEPGATATNTTNPVVITGTVNTAVAGTYYRYYNVSNEVGPANEVVRTVIVQDTPTPPTSSGRGINYNLWLSIE